MSKNRYAKKVDANQPSIVKALRSIPGVTVEIDHDDILVGHKGVTRWYELKSDLVIGKDGKPRESSLKPSQRKLIATFTGHYRVVSSLGEILEDMGIQ